MLKLLREREVIFLKRILLFVMAVGVVLCGAPAAGLAETIEKAVMPTEVCRIDLSMLQVGDKTADYEVTDALLLKSCEKTYILSGKTSLNIQFANTGVSGDLRYYIRLNGIETTGDILQGNDANRTVMMEIVRGTANKVNTITFTQLQIFGKGSLSVEDISAHPLSRKPSLTITDAAVTITPTAKSVQWEHSIELAGSARVTFRESGACASLEIGRRVASTVTLKDNARLYFLQDELHTEVPFREGGMKMSPLHRNCLVMQDGSYLEMESEAFAADMPVEHWDYGMSIGGDLIMKDNATFRVTAYGQPIAVYDASAFGQETGEEKQTKSNGGAAF